MRKGLILKCETLENLSELMKINSYSPVCKIIGKNGQGKLNTITLAVISPFLKDLLFSLNSSIDSCIILPDFDWEEIEGFLVSLSDGKENIKIRDAMQC